MSRTGSESGLVVEHEDAEVLNWRNDHLATRKELELVGVQKEASPLAQEIDMFVGDHLKSADTCHSKILEARRTLDGITAQVLAMEERNSLQAELRKSQGICQQMEDKTIAKYADE